MKNIVSYFYSPIFKKASGDVEEAQIQEVMKLSLLDLDDSDDNPNLRNFLETGNLSALLTEPKKYYFERQVASYCAQHALNNLFQNISRNNKQKYPFEFYHNDVRIPSEGNSVNLTYEADDFWKKTNSELQLDIDRPNDDEGNYAFDFIATLLIKLNVKNTHKTIFNITPAEIENLQETSLGFLALDNSHYISSHKFLFAENSYKWRTIDSISRKRTREFSSLSSNLDYMKEREYTNFIFILEKT